MSNTFRTASLTITGIIVLQIVAAIVAVSIGLPFPMLP